MGCGPIRSRRPLRRARLLLQSREEEEEQDAAFIREMKLEVFKIEQYVEMVLAYLRMEEMSSDLDFREYSLDDVIRQAVRKYSRMFILKRIRLDFHGDRASGSSPMRNGWSSCWNRSCPTP